jgi:hypothetical protein
MGAPRLPVCEIDEPMLATCPAAIVVGGAEVNPLRDSRSPWPKTAFKGSHRVVQVLRNDLGALSVSGFAAHRARPADRNHR